MTDVQLELNDPAVLRVLLDIPTMQRWEILRRTQRALSVAELAAEAGATVEEVQRSLDRLVQARLVHASRATARRRQIGAVDGAIFAVVNVLHERAASPQHLLHCAQIFLRHLDKDLLDWLLEASFALLEDHFRAAD